MSTFVNTVDVVGDEALTKSIIDRSITELADNISTRIGNSAFFACTALKTVNFPNVTRMESSAFASCTALEKADFAALVYIADTAFYRCSAMTALILRGAAVCTLNQSASTLGSSSIKNGGTGYVYVPSALVDSYKAASGWSKVADQIRAIEDYPEICDPYTWEAVFKAIDAGTYADTYKVGDLVPLDLGDEGIVNMQIAGIDVDDKADGTGKAPISWISKELLATNHRWNPSRVINYTYETVDAWAETDTNTWQSQTQNYTDGIAEATWTITAIEAGTLTVQFKTSKAKSYNLMTVIANGETWLNNSYSTTGESESVDVAAGEIVTVYASYTMRTKGSQYGQVIFTGTGAFTVVAEVGETKQGTVSGYQEVTGTIGGWEKSELRAYMQETIKPLIPETVRGRLVSVSKMHAAYDTSGNIISQTTNDDVWLPTRGEVLDPSGKYAALFPDNTSRKKYKNAAINNWWMRDAYSTSDAYHIGTGGGYGMLSSVNSNSLVLCFCT